jgi:hypothetical protein
MIMEKRKFISISAIVGLFIPLTIIAISIVITSSGNTSDAFGLVAWVLWPTAIYLLKMSKGVINSSLFIVGFISIIVNVFLYAFVGGIIWYGWHKHRIVLFSAGLVLIGWILFVMSIFI